MKISKVGLRTAILAGLVLVVFALFGVRLMQLQIVQGEEYLALAEAVGTMEYSREHRSSASL